MHDALNFAIHLGGVGVAIGIIYSLSRVIYNVYFHPLAKFPGPRWAAASNIFYVFGWAGGRWPFVLEDLHKKYGPVVRFAPNDLNFTTPQSCQDIYGHARQDRSQFLKSIFYENGPVASQSIFRQRDPLKHRELRRSLSHAFSAKALRSQSDVVLFYINLWIDQIKLHADNEEGIPTDEWYNWLSFDIIGDLAFGEPFDAVKNAKSHPWVTTIKKSFHESTFTDIFRRVPLLKLFPRIIKPKAINNQRRELHKISREKAQRRMDMDNDREDFFSHLLSEKATNVTLDFLNAQATLLIVAGSETTATFLAGVTYFLLRNPSTLCNLNNEVRSAFSDPTDIDSDTTQTLPYLFAVIEEGLRMFPPVPAGLSRISPGADVDGHFVPAGTSVSVSAWVAAHCEDYFRNAHDFHPERWLPIDHPLYDSAYINDMKDASKPFSLGPRGCLGINLAYMEMRIILARMVWEFDLELVSQNIDWNRDVRSRFLWQKPELRVRFRQR